MEVVYLPVPPSANALFVQSGRRRVKTQPYKDWITESWVYWSHDGHDARDFEDIKKYKVLILARMRKNRDLDNIIKPTLDFLQATGAIGNDKNVEVIEARRAQFGSGDGLAIAILDSESPHTTHSLLASVSKG